MKIKAKEKKGIVKVKVLMKHAMESGRRKDKEGNLIPAHHITEASATYQGRQVFHVEMGPAVSKNPFVAFAFNGSKGETLAMNWVDSEGKTMSVESTIK